MPIYHDDETVNVYEHEIALVDSLKENDSFNFIIDSDKKDLLCAVCYAYTPTPEKSVSITVLD